MKKDGLPRITCAVKSLVSRHAGALCMAHQPNPVFSTPATAQQQQLRLALFNFSIFLFGLLLYIFFSSIYLTRRHLKGKEYKDYNRHKHCRLSPYIHYISFQVDEQCAQQLGPDVGLSFSSILFSLSLSLLYIYVCTCMCCVYR
jgi:hypothetical protein